MSIVHREINEIKELEVFLSQEEIALFLSGLDKNVGTFKDKKIQIGLDLEQLQVTYYPKLYTSEKLNDILECIQSSKYYTQVELYYITLRSLFMLNWDIPKTKEELVSIIEFEIKMNSAIYSFANYLDSTRIEKAPLIPYWARFAQFRLYDEIPKQNEEFFKLDDIPCIVIKTMNINAHTFSINGQKIIALDYALDFFLRRMNSLILMFYNSQEIAGPKRIENVFNQILSTVLYFKGLIPPYKLTPFCISFGKTTPLDIKNITLEQEKFILGHELGHIRLNHESERMKYRDARALNTPDNIFEYEADTYSINWYRSKVFNAFRSYLHPKHRSFMGGNNKVFKALENALSGAFNILVCIELLFIYMDIVDSYYKRICDVSGLAQYMDVSPKPMERFGRIKEYLINDVPLNSDFIDYVRDLLYNSIIFMDNLTKEELQLKIKEFS